ncbi:hypothetical protein JL722_5572 [Aureococcus anophagefferens]|nr:hypothetical protein JL722_5572 [Aureococcus anophagefferens]
MEPSSLRFGRSSPKLTRGARPRAALFGAAAAVEAVEEEAVPEDAAASRASLMEAFAARDRERADLVKILSPGKGGGGGAEADADAAARREARRAREADRQRRKEEKRRRERREAAKVAAAANVAAERSDDLLRRQRLDDAQLAGDATDGPGTARSLASSASDAVFLTEKRPRSKRSRFRDRNRAESPPKEDEKPATDFVLDNKHRQGRSLLTMEQEFRALHLALEGDAACDDVLEARGLRRRRRRAPAIGGRRRAAPGPGPRGRRRRDDPRRREPREARRRAVAARGPGRRRDDYLARARTAASRRELDVDKRLAAARGAPLVVLDDDDSDGDAPATAVRLGTSRARRRPAAGAGEAASRERLDALLAAMGPAIATAAAVRDERRRRRAGGGDENDARRRWPRRRPSACRRRRKPRSAKKRRAKRPKARAFGELADALESALRTKSALGQADDAIKRSLASKDVGAAFFDDDGDVGALEPPDDAGRRGAAVFDDDDDGQARDRARLRASALAGI